MGRKLLHAFEQEVGKIHSTEISNMVKDLLVECDDKNAKGAASSSGKYHPKFSLGDGGLVRHTKVVCANVERFMKMLPQYDDPFEWDVPYAAAILHDLCKYIKGNEHTQSKHPLLMAEKIRAHKNEYSERIAQCVETHMSRWNEDPRNGEKWGELPKSLEHFIVAVSDMISAGKYIDCRFDEQGNLTNYYENV